MPFVIPRVHVPENVNTSGTDVFSWYTGNPSVEQLEKYREWLAGEIANVDKAIEVAKYGADVVTTETTPADTTTGDS